SKTARSKPPTASSSLPPSPRAPPSSPCSSLKPATAKPPWTAPSSSRPTNSTPSRPSTTTTQSHGSAKEIPIPPAASHGSPGSLLASADGTDHKPEPPNHRGLSPSST